MSSRRIWLARQTKIDESWLEIDETSGLVKYSEEMKSARMHTRSMLSINNVLSKSFYTHYIYSYPFYDGQSKGEYNAMVRAASLPKDTMSVNEFSRAVSGKAKARKYRPNYYDEIKKLLSNRQDLKEYLEKIDAEKEHQSKLRQSSDVFYREKSEDIEQNKVYLKKYPHQVGDKVILFNTYWSHMSNPIIDKIESISKKGNIFLGKAYGYNHISHCFFPSGQHFHEPGGQLWFIPYGRACDLTWLCDAEKKKLYFKEWEEYELQSLIDKRNNNVR